MSHKSRISTKRRKGKRIARKKGLRCEITETSAKRDSMHSCRRLYGAGKSID